MSSTTIVTLRNGKVAIIDANDSDLVSSYRWYEVRMKDTSYAATSVDGKTYYMHRLIMGVSNGKDEVDHKNGNGLDNRRDNLRVVSHQQNLANQKLSRANSTGYKGVTRNRTGTFMAQAKVNGEWQGLGSYHTAEEAARAYDYFMRETFGEHAKLNFPSEVLDQPPQRITIKERCRNTSGYTGVVYIGKRNKSKPWMAQIKKNGKHFWLGNFTTPEEASLAYIEAAKRLRNNSSEG